MRHAQCIKVDWPESDTSVVWTTLFYWPGAPEIWYSIIAGISAKCIPEGSIVYTRLKLLDEDRKAWQGPIIVHGGFVQMSRDQIVGIYQRDWEMTWGLPRFFICKEPLHDLRVLNSGRFSSKLRKQVLDRVYLILFSHYDHGFEIIGKSISPDTLLEVAREVSTNYDLPLEVQEAGDPFGELQTH